MNNNRDIIKKEEEKRQGPYLKELALIRGNW